MLRMSRKVTQPSSAPKAMPPKTSTPKSFSTSLTRWSSEALPVAMLRMVRKTTTPTPSLKSDSPTILVSSFFGTPACFSTPSTAMGSVGLISAPKSRQWMKATGCPMAAKTQWERAPTRKVLVSTPTVAKTRMGQRCSFSRSQSVCMAPAKSRKPSMMSSTMVLKSISPTMSSVWRSRVSSMALVRKSPTVKRMATSMSPMVLGRRKSRMFT